MSDLNVLLSDRVLVESPRWHAGRLWFADWGTQEIVAVDLAATSESIVRVPAFPFCIDWLPDGRLLIVSASERRLLRQEPDGSLVTPCRPEQSVCPALERHRRGRSRQRLRQ